MDKKSILVADYDPSSLKFLTTCFVSAEYRVLQALNGNQTLELAKQLPNLIVLNTMLPDINGFEVCKRLKSNRETSKIPIVFIPEPHGDDVIAKCFEMGGDDYLCKPFREAAILSRVRIRMNLKNREGRVDHYRQIVEKAADIIYCADRKGRLNYVNPFAERLLGFSREEIIGKSYLEFIRPDFAVKVKQFHLHQIKEKVEKIYTEFPVMTKSRKHLWLAQQAQLLIQDGEIVGFQAIARDISQTRRMEKDLRNIANELEITNRQLIQANDHASEMAAKAEFANMAQNELLADLSREINTSVDTMGRIISQLSDTVLSDTQRQYVETIRSSGEQLRNLIRDMVGEVPK